MMKTSVWRGKKVVKAKEAFFKKRQQKQGGTRLLTKLGWVLLGALKHTGILAGEKVREENWITPGGCRHARLRGRDLSLKQQEIPANRSKTACFGETTVMWWRKWD